MLTDEDSLIINTKLWVQSATNYQKGRLKITAIIIATSTLWALLYC